jgi:DNA-binding MarR family transcriptional regulator
LIHDEIGLPELDLEQTIDFDDVVNEYQEIEENDDIDKIQSNNYEQISPLIKVLHDLLVMNISSDKVSSNPNKLAEALSNMRREKQGEKQDFTLNPLVLSSLSNSESYVVSIAQQRRFSPSDKEILTELKIKRPRLSQISNRLLKSGILNVRTVGRSRFFELTQAARAQLTAWGLIGGVE